jgi:hypothetical protein
MKQRLPVLDSQGKRVSCVLVANRLLAWVSVLLSHATILARFPTRIVRQVDSGDVPPSRVVSSEVASGAPSGW